MIGSGYTGGNNLDLSGSLDTSDIFGFSVSLDGIRLAVGAPSDDGFTASGNINTADTGAVYLFTELFSPALDPTIPVADAQFAINPAGNVTITPASLTALLNAGNDVLLQANNNITFAEAVIANNPGGDGGNLAAHAGNSIFVNANIVTDNGDLEFRANGDGADGWVTDQRDVGTANILVADGVDIDAGTGSISWTLNSGGGALNAIAGDITFSGNSNIAASHVELLNFGNDAFNQLAVVPVVGRLENDDPQIAIAQNFQFADIPAVGQNDRLQLPQLLATNGINFGAGTQVTASGTGDAIVTASKQFTNNAGADVFNLTGGGRFLVGATNNDAVQKGGLVGGNFYGVDLSAGGSVQQVGAQGNRFVFADQPTLSVTIDDKTREYGLGNPDFTVSTSGLINDDTLEEAMSVAGIVNEATAGSNVGDYAITATANTITSPIGYKISVTNGTLTVTPAPLTVTANDETRFEGRQNPAFSATVTGLRNEDDASVVTGLGFVTDGVTQSPAGDYFIRPIGGTATNYTLTRVGGVLTVVAVQEVNEIAPDATETPGTTERDAIAATIRIVETPDTTTGFSIAPIFTSGLGTGTGTGAGAGLGGIITAAVSQGGNGIPTSNGDEAGGTQGPSGSDGDQISGGLVVEVEVEGQSGSDGSFSFQLPPDFTGCASEGACDGIPDSVFFSSFVVAN